MKRIRFFKNITDYIINNRMKFFLALICLVLGIVIGSLSAIFLGVEEFDSLGIFLNNFTSAHTIHRIDYGAVMGFSIYNNIKVILFMWISGFWIGLIPLGMLQLCSKGYKLGFTTVVLVQIYRANGIIFSLASIIPQVILLIPTLMFYMVFNFNFALNLREIRRHGQTLWRCKELLAKNCICLLLITFIIILNSLVDTFVIPPVLKPICSYVTR